MGLERMRRIVDIGDAAVHARREVDADLAQNENEPAGHVLAAVVTDALDDERGARITRGETLPRKAVHEPRARRRAIEGDVAPTMTFSSGLKFARLEGATATVPPERPLPK